jgi:hypothetical protein
VVRSWFCRWVLKKDNEEASKVLSLKPFSSFKIQFHDYERQRIERTRGSYFVKKKALYDRALKFTAQEYKSTA